ncbi:hypothetical protein H8S90_15545 [Olivibacter sp. SDN3]|uniref:bestrophin family protein n=1 Tax=Olivibacter sp. SDN3 TaxID=2764720 RepID=UPI001651A379|nr:bestrophin family ion channel [Olivibacter sp. SDN3]QNL48210.1 hypothetical protein H8S90_15545 [Olivibacter sp. SDN3]
MIVRKTLNLKAIYEFGGHHLWWLAAWMSLITVLYHYTHWKWITIPWLPMSVIGTAVAFYVGFKNNQSYDRLWESRKIWGAIINNSRMLATMVKHFVASDTIDQQTLQQLKKRMLYRHIAYLYTLREQLLVPTEWEHVNLRWLFGSYNRKRRDRLWTAYRKELEELSTRPYLESEELASYEGLANKATHLIDRQTEDLAKLYRNGCVNMMQHIELQRVLNSFYDEQGKAERIKKFPFPRQYGSFSLVFVSIFVFLLPFGIVAEFSKLGDDVVWLCIPFGVLVGWIYVLMEMIGDYSENPFEGLFNDAPMLSICRTIEIDLLQMLGENNIPKPIQPKNGILM